MDKQETEKEILNLLNTENIVAHLSPVEARLYRSSDELGKFEVLMRSKYVMAAGTLLKGVEEYD